MFFHADTGQIFRTKGDAQERLKILGPDLAPVTILPRPDLGTNERASLASDPTFTGGEWTLGWVIEQIKNPTEADVNAERNRRLHADFEFNKTMFQRDPTSLQRITGAGTLAGFAMARGAQPGDLYWHGGGSPFAWIASDNTLMTMDAQTCFMFGQVCANVETKLIFAARNLRNMDPIPADYTDDKWWP